MGWGKRVVVGEWITRKEIIRRLEDEQYTFFFFFSFTLERKSRWLPAIFSLKLLFFVLFFFVVGRGFLALFIHLFIFKYFSIINLKTRTLTFLFFNYFLDENVISVPKEINLFWVFFFCIY